MNTHDQTIASLAKSRFGEYAANYVQSQDHANSVELSYLISLVQPAASWHMLDVATGGGHTALAFAPYVAQVIASDITPQMLTQAEAYLSAHKVHNVRYELVDALHMPFEAETFDLVTCRIAAHHFSDVKRFMLEAYRVLQVGGLLLVQDQVMPEAPMTARYIEAFEKLRDPSHNRAYSQHEWHTFFTDTGFQVTASEKIRRDHHFKQWTERQQVSPSTIESLNALLLSAPADVKACMQPVKIGTEEAVFTSHHLIILGKKSLE